MIQNRQKDPRQLELIKITECRCFLPMATLNVSAIHEVQNHVM
uniref:Uncharacterized protein n=1 Tax=Anguilla anguilla TaxID=7936 RepID=A0A0E9SZK0_ANGAN